MAATKNIEIVAGPNGSGKTTFAESFLLRKRNKMVFLNPDLIASGIGPLSSEQASFQAGRILISEVKNRIARGESFAFESTLSGRNWFQTLQNAKQSGYEITIYFLFLNSIKQNLKRIKERVANGGHNIPTQAVIRRQPRCFENFWQLYRPITEEWYIFDNSKDKPDLILSKSEFDQMTEIQKDKFSQDFRNGRLYGRKRRKT